MAKKNRQLKFRNTKLGKVAKFHQKQHNILLMLVRKSAKKKKWHGRRMDMHSNHQQHYGMCRQQHGDGGQPDVPRHALSGGGYHLLPLVSGLGQIIHHAAQAWLNNTKAMILASGVVWALSALSIMMVVIATYFWIFFIMMYAIFLPIAYFYRVLHKVIWCTLKHSKSSRSCSLPVFSSSWPLNLLSI